MASVYAPELHHFGMELNASSVTCLDISILKIKLVLPVLLASSMILILVYLLIVHQPKFLMFIAEDVYVRGILLLPLVISAFHVFLDIFIIMIPNFARLVPAVLLLVKIKQIVCVWMLVKYTLGLLKNVSVHMINQYYKKEFVYPVMDISTSKPEYVHYVQLAQIKLITK